MEILLMAIILSFLLGMMGKPQRRRRRWRRRTFSNRLSTHLTGTVSGKAYVTDGDGIRVAGQEVRFAGLDAPEWNQVAKHSDGYWLGHGKRVKSALIREIGGKYVHVQIEDYDKFGRAIGTVTYNGRDIGEWLVSQGYARALYSRRYKNAEWQAKNDKKGMWGYAVNIDPRSWRHRKMKRN